MLTTRAIHQTLLVEFVQEALVLDEASVKDLLASEDANKIRRIILTKVTAERRFQILKNLTHKNLPLLLGHLFLKLKRDYVTVEEIDRFLASITRSLATIYQIESVHCWYIRTTELYCTQYSEKHGAHILHRDDLFKTPGEHNEN